MSKVQPVDASPHQAVLVRVRVRFKSPNEKIKPPTKQFKASWVSGGIRQLKKKPDIVIHSFTLCFPWRETTALN